MHVETSRPTLDVSTSLRDTLYQRRGQADGGVQTDESEADGGEAVTEVLLRGVRLRLAAFAGWLRAQKLGLWLLLATVLLSHSRTRADKGVELRSIQRQVSAMDDFHITIVTTAALPWMTGTAINPLLRAAHLARAGKRVTLSVPWIHPSEQAIIFPGGRLFETPAQQEAYIRSWLVERAAVKADFRLTFYPARYNKFHRSILPLGDITRFFDDSEADICVLEEPEHLTWYHRGPNWRHRFKLVVGVVHTNYIYYAQTMPGGGQIQAALMKPLNSMLAAAYCDKVIKLSDALQPFPRAVTCNVHGVRSEFLDIGRRAAAPYRRFTRGAYFLGKVLWAKGHGFLIEYLARQREQAEVDGDDLLHVDVFGGGEDLEAVQAAAAEAQIDLTFHRGIDHADAVLREYKVFINPSASEVLSTATAEALAMGKFAVLKRHPSNAFFFQFTNALPFETADEFLAAFKFALDSSPAPLTADERRALSWEGATDRFLASIANCTVRELLPTFADHTARWVHHGVHNAGYLSDAFRFISGGGPISKQTWMGASRFASAPPTEIVDTSVAYSPLVAKAI